MHGMFRPWAAVAAAGAVCPGAAVAVTLDFAGIDDYGGAFGPEQVVESGVTIYGMPSAFGPDADSVHLDDSGTAYSAVVGLRAPRRFDVARLELEGLPQFRVLGGGRAAYANVRLTGVTGAGATLSRAFSTPPAGGRLDLEVPDAFNALERFEIAAVLPPHSAPGRCVSFPCGHFNVDWVEMRMPAASDVASAPLPAPGLLLAVALLGLSGRRLI